MKENRIRDAHIALGHLVEFCQRGVAVDPIGPHKVLAGFIKDVDSEGQKPPANPGMAWDLVEQTASRLADSMEEACFETSMALRPGLLEKLEFAISEATNKPGAWRESLIAGGFISAANGSPLGKLNGRRDAWLAVAAVNALPELIERVRGAELSERAADRKVEELQAEVARLRAENEEMRALALAGADTIIDIKTAEARVPLAPSRANRVYLAGPMTGYQDHNFPAFNAEAAKLRASGLDVVNPADHGIVAGAEWSDYLRYDIAKLAYCEAIHFLPGWQASRGAQLEHSVAKALGMPMSFADGAQPKPTELFSDAAEARIDVIGQNGNDGEHYAPQLALGEVLAAAAPDDLAEALIADDGWIEWKGHARPMVPFARVDLKLRDGSRLLGVEAGSYAWKWAHGHGDLDVIAYRFPQA